MIMNAGFNNQDDLLININLGVSVPPFERLWKIKVTQFRCGALETPPPCCDKYFTSIVGQVQSFNFGANTLNTVRTYEVYPIQNAPVDVSSLIFNIQTSSLH